MRRYLNFTLPDGYNKQRLIDELADDYSIRQESPVDGGMAIYDTFDWRLFKKSLVLYVCGKRVFLRKLAKSEIIWSAEIDIFPVFIKAFPEGELKCFLAPIIKMRALIKLADIHYQTTRYRILNADEKTVARLAYEEFQTSRRKNAPLIGARLQFKPVKGYPNYARAITGRIKAAGLLMQKGEDIYYSVLAAVGKTPGGYTAKVTVRLDPDMPSDGAVRDILRFLMQVMQTNEANIEKDLDTEFIHDFRVSIRRTRSALSQLKNVFPTRQNDRFKRDFTFVGKLTNELRDLDVLLLNEDRYRAMIPLMLRDGIDPLFEHLHRKRSRALCRVIRITRTKKYTTIMKNWESFLNEPQEDTVGASNAKTPVAELSRIRIYKKYRRIIKSGSRILENSEDEMLHMLRIHCKNLRYLMEFFYSLYPPQKMKVLIGQMKNLQNRLGSFNDLRIQRDYLLNTIEDLPVSRKKSSKTLAAVGSLVGTLDMEKRTAKKAVVEAFMRFASPANQKLFQDLFASAP